MGRSKDTMSVHRVRRHGFCKRHAACRCFLNQALAYLRLHTWSMPAIIHHFPSTLAQQPWFAELDSLYALGGATTSLRTLFRLWGSGAAFTLSACLSVRSIIAHLYNSPARRSGAGA